MNQPSKGVLSPFFPSLSPLIPGLGRSPGVGNDNSLQYSCLKNSMDRGAWWVTVHGVPESWTWLSDWAQLRNKMDTQRGEIKLSLINGNKLRDWDWYIHPTIIKQITNENLLYSTGHSTQHSAVTYMGKESKEDWIYAYIHPHTYITDSLCCIAESNIML